MVVNTLVAQQLAQSVGTVYSEMRWGGDGVLYWDLQIPHPFSELKVLIPPTCPF